jgi:RNA polymerase sigma factor (sigma-70 family)
MPTASPTLGTSRSRTSLYATAKSRVCHPDPLRLSATTSERKKLADPIKLLETLRQQVESGALLRQLTANRRLRKIRLTTPDYSDLQQQFCLQFTERVKAGAIDSEINCNVSYISTSLEHFVADHFRRLRRVRTLENKITYHGTSEAVLVHARASAPGRSPLTADQTADHSARIRDALDIMSITIGEMPEQRRRVIRLTMKGVPIEEVARELGITKSTAQNHFVMAIAEIKAAVQGNDNTPSPTQEPPR